MNTNNFRRYFLATLSSLFVAAMLTACGGSSDSSSGSGSTANRATISGNVNSGIASNESGIQDSRVLAVLVEMMVSDAHAAGVGGITVQLLRDGAVIDSQVTSANGDFQFTGLAPGSYSIQLFEAGQNVGQSPQIQLDSNTRTKLKLGINGSLMSVEVEAEDDQISGEVETEDDNSRDDQKSTDDDNSNDDQDSTDDESSNDDQKSEDECKKDASEDCDDD